MAEKLDVVGDVHGHLDALVALGNLLGYDVHHGWKHPEGRVLVFLGDLIDRGPHGLEVAELALDLCSRGRALALLGNHEHNIVGYRLGIDAPKHSNRQTVADLAARPRRWHPVVEAMRRMPIALELPELRLIHAEWHLACFELVEQALGRRAFGPAAPLEGLASRVVLGSPFEGDGLVAALPRDPITPGEDAPHEVLLKGHEAWAHEPFLDQDGKLRNRVRVTWWDGDRRDVATDTRTVFGHYWNVPPTGPQGPFVPPFPSGHPKLLEWHRAVSPLVPGRGAVRVPDEVTFVCVDYNGVALAGGGGCVGAYRHPEHEVVWARG